MATTAPRTTRTAPARRTEPLRLPRTTGALSGVVVIALGIWGGLIPFIGPYFHYAFGGYQAWHFTTQRLWLDIAPAIVAVVGGFMLLTAATRTAGLIGGWLAVAAGAWFAIGPVVSLLWHHTIYAIGVPAGGYTRQMLEWLGYFYGLGALIIGFAAFAMGRYFSRPRLVEEPVVAAEAATRERRAADRTGYDEPVAREGYDEPVARERYDEPVARERYDEPVARERYDEPAARERYDEPASREGYAEPAAREDYGEPADRADYREPADAPATTSTPADAPTTANAPAAAPATGASAGTTTRRRPGLLRRLRGE